MGTDEQRDVVWIAGANGMLGRALARVLEAHPGAATTIVKSDRNLDIASPDAVRDFVRAHRPTRMFNCAAYTAVDKAESEEAIAAIANATAPGVIADVCRASNVFCVQISTDYVFDGKKPANEAYVETDTCAPLGAYGRTKRAGEVAFLENARELGALVRTSWLFGPDGKCFPQTMLKLMQEREQLRVVDDQRGRPTYTIDLARAIDAVSKRRAHGTFHFANRGAVTWHGFAVSIMEEARARGIALKVKGIEAIPTSGYPTPATRPANSVLDTTKIERTLGDAFVVRPWIETLRDWFAGTAGTIAP